MNTLPSLFQSSLIVYVPLGVFAAFALLMTAGLHVTGAKPEGVAKAIGCMIMKTLGLILLSLSLVQLTYGLISMTLEMSQTFLALILLFVIGAGLMLHESRMAAHIDKASASVPNLVFTHCCRVIGCLIATLAGLSLLLSFVLMGDFSGAAMPVTLLMLGLLLSLSSSVHANGGVKYGKTAKRKR